MASGGCYCGKIRFSFEGEASDVVYCHCSQCRKFSGHYVAASSGVEPNVEGEVKWYESSPDVERGFCGVCGTQVFWRDRRDGDHWSIMAGAFDEGTMLKAQDHIFVENKADYYPICDGLPQYAKERS